MRISFFVISVAVGGAVALAVPPEAVESLNSPKARDPAAVARSTCTNPATHYEWRNLADTHKVEFVAAMKCLFSKPARSGLVGVQNRWDDLVAINQQMTRTVNEVGQYLPWYRYFLHIFESEMRNTCGYTGPMTWWDETKDAGHFNTAPMMTAQYFGNVPNGLTPKSKCVTIGQFANTTCHIGPGMTDTNHCLSRDVDEGKSSEVTQSYINTCLSYSDFASMENCLYLGPNGLGHNAIGGDMEDIYASVNDPLFFLHTAFIDRAWRTWQKTSPSTRTYAIGGYTTPNCVNNCQPTTLNYQLTSFSFYPAVSIEEVMDTTGSLLCYKYDY